MSEIKPCAKCGKTPMLERYEQSNDGNHDKSSMVVCNCGNGYSTGFVEWSMANDVLGDEVYECKTAYMSEKCMRFIDDMAVYGWNASQEALLKVEPSCDRDALLALADTVHGMGVDCDAEENYAFGCTLQAIADRIREAVGA